MELPHSLSRSLVIRAPRAVVFGYFTDSARFAAWWGEGSTIEPRVGGDVLIVYPNDIRMRGEVRAIEENASITFTWGYENSHPELPPGSSLVTIRLSDDPHGTRLELTHDLPSETMRDHHVAGWRYHLSVFANVATAAHHSGAATMIDRWFEAWTTTDADERMRLLTDCAIDDVVMLDPYSCLQGRDELAAHIANYHVHMPGITTSRAGDVRQCQGEVLVDWSAKDTDGNPRGAGCNHVSLAPDGRIAAVTGFWQPPTQ